MNEPRAEPAFTAHLEEVVPLWVAVLAAGVCRAYGIPATAAAMDAIVSESYEEAFTLFLAQAEREGRIERQPAAKGADGR